MTFKKLSSIAFANWSYEDTTWIMKNDQRKLILEVAKYVMKKKFKTK